MKVQLSNFALSTTLSIILGSLFVTNTAGAVVIDTATQPASTASPYVLSDTDLSSGTEKAFRPWFENGAWQGDMIQYNVSVDGALSTTVDLSTTPPTNSGANWSARLQFAAKLSADSTYWQVGKRNVITSTTGTNQVNFDWANLTSSQQGQVDSVAAGASAATSDILNYIRGDQSKETDATPTPGTLRKRYSILGDMIHTTAVYVGTPAASFNLPGYNAYKTTNKAGSPVSGQADRTPIVYAGANDGMLHAFDAATGNEVFAYVPSMVFGNLSKLTADPYIHTYFVDGALSGGDINFDTTNIDWRTILVGGLGSGGKGLFALDVTHDTLSGHQKVLWEKTGNAYGYIHGKAQIALLNDNKWYVIQGNGYGSTDDVAKLLLIEADGTVTEIATDASITGNGLSSPALVDMNSDGKPDYAYAGDLKGNLWKFNLTTKTAALKLFVAGTTQPITTTPDIARHPNGGVIVYFGTGSLLSGPNTATADTANKDAQTFYGIWDNNSTVLINNDASILNQPLTEMAYAAATIIRYSTNNTTIDWSTNKGWKVPFPTAGERLVGDPQLRAGRLQFITTSFAADGQPVAWLMELNYLNGGNNGNVIFDLDNDTIRDGVDTVNRPVDGGGNPIGTGDVPVAIKYGSYGIYAQPTIARINNSADTLLVNGMLMPLPQPCSGSCSEGFIGGHMDVDTDSPFGGTEAQRDWSPNSGSNSDGHQHEYDKEHGVVFLDWFDLEPRRGLFSLNIASTTTSLPAKLNRITEVCDPDDVTSKCASNETAANLFGAKAGDSSLDKEFFIVLANADINSGGTITIGKKTWKVKDYSDMITPIIAGLGNRDVSATGLAADRAKMVDADGDSLIFTLNKIKDSGGTLRIDFDNRAIIEGRLHATIYNCTWGSSDPYDKGSNPLTSNSDAHITNAQEKDVTGYRWRNGALTMQLVDAKNYKLQPLADIAHDASNNPVGGVHIYNYTQTKFADSGDFITAQKQVNLVGPPVVKESGLLYEGYVFNHWGAMLKYRNGQNAMCYGAPGYQTSIAIEQEGLLSSEYAKLTSPFLNDPQLQADFAAALKAFNEAANEADLKAAKEALAKIVNDNNLGQYFKLRTYVRDKVKSTQLFDWDKGIAGEGTTGTTTPAEVQDASKDTSQLGQNFRTGRRTWIDLTP